MNHAIQIYVGQKTTENQWRVTVIEEFLHIALLYQAISTWNTNAVRGGSRDFKEGVHNQTCMLYGVCIAHIHEGIQSTTPYTNEIWKCIPSYMSLTTDLHCCLCSLFLLYDYDYTLHYIDMKICFILNSTSISVSITWHTLQLAWSLIPTATSKSLFIYVIIVFIPLCLPEIASNSWNCQRKVNTKVSLSDAARAIS